MEADVVIKRLVQLTQEGRLLWDRHSADDGLTLGTDDLVEIYYTARHNGHRLRLYQARYRHFYDEGRAAWDTETRLETIDGHGLLFWRFPPSRWTGDLIQAVAYQTADVDTLYKDLLNEGEE